MRSVNLGNGDYVTFNPILGNREKDEIEGILHLHNGKEYKIRMNVENRENPTATTDKFFSFTSEKKAMQKLVDKATLSPSEARKALQGLAKFFKNNTNVQTKQSPSEAPKAFQGFTKLFKNGIAQVKQFPSEAQKAFQGLAESFKSSIHVQTKREAASKMVSDPILEDTANVRLAGLCGPDRLAEVYTQRDQAIFSMDNAQHYGNIMKAIFEKALNNPDNKVSADSIPEKISELQSTIDGILNRQPQGELSKTEFLDRIKAMKKAVIDQLDQLTGKKGGAGAFKKYYPLALSGNTSAWQPLTETFNLINRNGEEVKVTSSLKSANQTGAFSYLGGPGQPQGVSSMERDTPNATNLWETEVKLPGSEKPLFQGIRHGCTRGQDGASKEILVACLVQKFGIEKLTNPQPTMSESGNNPNGTKEHPFPLQLANMQLMTPEGRLIGISTDRSLPQQQMDTFRKLAKQPQPITLNFPAPDGKETIYVQLEPPLLFNFGSNLQQFNTIAHAVLAKNLSQKNNESLKDLLGDSAAIDPKKIDPHNIDLETEKTIFSQDSLVGKFLNNSEISEEDKKIVVQLAHQIADIWQSGRYATDGSDPYAIQSRIALLTYKLGLSTTFNCKSGKDRTGVANAEINNLAAEIAMNGGIVPQPYHTLDNREKLNLNIMLNNSGANHVTKACTGLAGLKIVDSFGPLRFLGVKNRMGDVQGASSEAKEELT